MPPNVDPKTLAQIFSQSAIGVAIVGLDGAWIEVNDKLCEIVRYPRTELLEKTFQEITHKDDVHDDVALVQECLRGERDHYSMVKRYMPKFGKPVWITLVVNAHRDDDGKVIYFISQIIPLANGAHGIEIEKTKHGGVQVSEPGISRQWLEAEFGHIKTRLSEIHDDGKDVSSRVNEAEQQLAEHRSKFQMLTTVGSTIATGLTSAIGYLWGK